MENKIGKVLTQDFLIGKCEGYDGSIYTIGYIQNNEEICLSKLMHTKLIFLNKLKDLNILKDDNRLIIPAGSKLLGISENLDDDAMDFKFDINGVECLFNISLDCSEELCF